jgi:pimeloyl-ACP methyl ester carboxylesterase
MKQWSRHLSVALAAFTITGVLEAGQSGQADQNGSAAFTVFLRGQRIGSEQVSVNRSPAGWLISATGRTGAPLSISFDKFLARYGPEWQAQSLEISGQMRSQGLVLNTEFKAGTATSDVVQSGQQARVTHTVSANTVALPNNFYGAYEALALRLHTAQVGATIPIYVAPQAEVMASVTRITPRRMEASGARFELRQFDVSFQNPNGPLLVEVWVDTRGRLARISIPVASLAVVRDDLTGVMARLDSYSHPRDENVFIPGNGFSLAGTITKPENIAKPPVVILVSGSGPQDRDETVFGIPVLGQVAGRLSDAGFFVVRYDKRGVGQSGGRIESTSIEAYADDVRGVVDWIRKRKDVDRDRIAVVGHSEGGAVALLVGSQMRGEVRALGLIAAPGQTGREITLMQQGRALDKLKESEGSRRAKVDLQVKVMDAVTTGIGWETVPPELRRQSDTAWFKSWLLFDPAEAMRRTNQHIFIVQGSLDTQVPPDQADRLEAMANARRIKSVTPTRKVVAPGINHLLVPARTGEVEEYPALPVKIVAVGITDPLIAWLKEVFPAKK